MSTRIATLVSWICAVALGSVASNDPARAFAKLLLAHDQSIASLEWDQTEETLHEVAPEHREWVLSRDGRFGEDDAGNWYWWGRQGMQAAPDSRELAYEEVRYTSTPEETLGWSVAQNAVGIRPPTDEQRFHPTPLLCLGRWLDIWGTQRLGEILLQSDELAIHAKDVSHGLVTLRARATLDGVPSILLVTMDVTKNGAPTAILRFDETRNLLVEHIVVEEYALFDETWIPQAGTRAMYTAAPLSPAQDQLLLESFSRWSMKLGLDQQHPDVRTAACGEVFGAAGYPAHELAPPIRFRVTAVHSVNAGLSEKYAIFTVRPDTTVVNLKTGFNTEETSRDQVIGRCPLLRTEPADASHGSGDLPGGRP